LMVEACELRGAKDLAEAKRMIFEAMPPAQPQGLDREALTHREKYVVMQAVHALFGVLQEIEDPELLRKAIDSAAKESFRVTTLREGEDVPHEASGDTIEGLADKFEGAVAALALRARSEALAGPLLGEAPESVWASCCNGPILVSNAAGDL